MPPGRTPGVAALSLARLANASGGVGAPEDDEFDAGRSTPTLPGITRWMNDMQMSVSVFLEHESPRFLFLSQSEHLPLHEKDPLLVLEKSSDWENNSGGIKAFVRWHAVGGY